MKEMRLLLPGIWDSGGLFVAMKFTELTNEIIPTRIFTYVDKEKEYPFVDMKALPEDEEIIWAITWGPHINRLLDRLGDRKVIYYAQSTCWGNLHVDGIPILCVSRFVMSHFAKHAPTSPLYLVEPALDPNCRNMGSDRDIDVLCVSRKSTEYLDKILVPKLQKKLKVHIQNEFILRDKLYELYNRSKVYLYSSQQPPFGLGDGFGLQPLEALVCGCTVFSNLHGGLSDYLDPEVCGYKLETFSLEYDVNRILKKVREYSAENSKSEYLRQKYSIKSFNDKMKVIWPEIEDFLQTKNRAPQTLISDLCAQRPSLYFRARKRLRNGLAKTGPLKRRERF
jgi:hypothetical protein